MGDKIFLDKDGIFISSKRFSANGQTFALDDIISFKFENKEPSFSILFISFGMFFYFVYKHEIAIALTFPTLAGFYAIAKETGRTLTFQMKGGSRGKTALTFTRPGLDREVTEALHEALTHRASA